mgnify:FL=1
MLAYLDFLGIPSLKTEGRRDHSTDDLHILMVTTGLYIVWIFSRWNISNKDGSPMIPMRIGPNLNIIQQTILWVQLLTDLSPAVNEVGPDPGPQESEEERSTNQLDNTTNDNHNVGLINGTTNYSSQSYSMNSNVYHLPGMKMFRITHTRRRVSSLTTGIWNKSLILIFN